MQITILGGGGFLGRKLAHRLAADGALDGRTVTGLTLFDLVAPAPVAAPFPVRCLGGNIADAEAVKAAIPPAPTWWCTWPPWSRPRRKRISTSA